MFENYEVIIEVLVPVPGEMICVGDRMFIGNLK